MKFPFLLKKIFKSKHVKHIGEIALDQLAFEFVDKDGQPIQNEAANRRDPYATEGRKKK